MCKIIVVLVHLRCAVRAPCFPKDMTGFMRSPCWLGSARNHLGGLKGLHTRVRTGLSLQSKIHRRWVFLDVSARAATRWVEIPNDHEQFLNFANQIASDASHLYLGVKPEAQHFINSVKELADASFDDFDKMLLSGSSERKTACKGSDIDYEINAAPASRQQVRLFADGIRKLLFVGSISNYANDRRGDFFGKPPRYLKLGKYSVHVWAKFGDDVIEFDFVIMRRLFEPQDLRELNFFGTTRGTMDRELKQFYQDNEVAQSVVRILKTQVQKLRGVSSIFLEVLVMEAWHRTGIRNACKLHGQAIQWLCDCEENDVIAKIINNDDLVREEHAKFAMTKLQNYFKDDHKRRTHVEMSNGHGKLRYISRTAKPIEICSCELVL